MFLKKGKFWITIGLVISFATFAAGALKLKHEIEANAKNELIIQLKNEEIKRKNILLEKQQKEKELKEEILKEQEEKFTSIINEYKTLFENLGTDSSDQAAESLKETIRRFKQRSNRE